MCHVSAEGIYIYACVLVLLSYHPVADGIAIRCSNNSGFCRIVTVGPVSSNRYNPPSPSYRTSDGVAAVSRGSLRYCGKSLLWHITFLTAYRNDGMTAYTSPVLTASLWEQGKVGDVCIVGSACKTVCETE